MLEPCKEHAYFYSSMSVCLCVMKTTVRPNYRIAGNVCCNYILRLVVKSKVCSFNDYGLHNTSLLMHLHQHIFADKMFAELRQNRKLQKNNIFFSIKILLYIMQGYTYS